MKKIPFSKMFPDYEPIEDYYLLVTHSQILSADLDPGARTVDMSVFSEAYIPQRILDAVSTEIRELYGLSGLSIRGVHPADQLTLIESQELRNLFVAEDSMNRGTLAGADWHWEGTTLHVDLVANGKEELLKCWPKVRQNLRERFDVVTELQVHPGQELQGKELFEAMKKLRGTQLSSLPAKAAAETKKPQAAAESAAIYGKPFKGKITPMAQMDLNSGSVIVEGRVFAVDHKELKKRNAWVINFDMTDNYGSVRVNRFMENSEAKPSLENIKVGSVIQVQGRPTENRFDNELVLKPYAIMPGSMPKRKDTAEGEKRVELHLHTVMSNMDALTNTKAAIKQAAAWGHRAIAITDHGCCQSFTDALHTIEDWKGAPKVAGTDETIKILYGCEGYFINDVDDRIVVHGEKDISLDDE